MRRAEILDGLFDAGVRTRLAPIPSEVEPLYEAEWQAVAHTVEARQREFVTGRRLAHELLRELGARDAPLLPREDRVPRWPEGVVGSISHTADLCAVAVARSDQWRSVALDVEPFEALEPALWELVCTPAECRYLVRAPERWRGVFARMLFSAKESVYKAVYPMLRRVLEFHEVELEPELSLVSRRGRFHARLPHGASLDGRLRWSRELIATSCAVEAIDPSLDDAPA